MDLERSSEHEIDPEWIETVRANLEGALSEEMYPFFDQLVNISPTTLTYDEDPRTFQEATPEEQAFLVDTLFEIIGHDPANPNLQRTYQIESPDPSIWEGIAEVKVYQTSRSLQDQFLHEVHFPDKRVEFSIAPLDKNI